MSLKPSNSTRFSAETLVYLLARQIQNYHGSCSKTLLQDGKSNCSPILKKFSTLGCKYFTQLYLTSLQHIERNQTMDFILFYVLIVKYVFILLKYLLKKKKSSFRTQIYNNPINIYLLFMQLSTEITTYNTHVNFLPCMI